jgi:hypothetical protein
MLSHGLLSHRILGHGKLSQGKLGPGMLVLGHGPVELSRDTFSCRQPLMHVHGITSLLTYLEVDTMQNQKTKVPMGRSYAACRCLR